MKRILVLTVLPLMLFALEKVNLIKDAGFEKNSDDWLEIAGGESPTDTAIANKHDEEKARMGLFSGSCDTRKAGPSNVHSDSAALIQRFCYEKRVSDLDSLIISYSVLSLPKSLTAFICIHTDSQFFSHHDIGYFMKATDITPSPASFWYLMKTMDFPLDSEWHSLSFDFRNDLINSGVPSNCRVDSLSLLDWGGYFPPWRGQKIYWDDIRLTGYADYDVGVKTILSKDSIGNVYTPTARIKNFGRKAADSFLVIAVIEGGSGTVYADTLTWSLTADTEDAVSFKEFKPSDASNYTLTVSTVMTPDESDEDDAMSKTLYGTGINEQPIPAGLVFEVSSFTRNNPSSFLVSYSIPNSEQGIISLYDPTGRRVESVRVQGSGRVTMNSTLSSGVYFIKLETSRTTIIRKTVVLR